MIETNINDDQLSVKNTFNAPIEKVFACFTQPELLSKWHTPLVENTSKVEVDLKIEGRFRIEMVSPDCQHHVAIGVYKEIDEPNKLVYTWGWEGDEHPETLVTVLFSTVADKTEVELIHTGFNTKETTEHHSQGWNALLGNLEQILS